MDNISNFLNKIILGDCIDILKTIEDESIDLIFADPPYFMQTDGVLLRSDGRKFSGVNDDWDRFSDFKEYDDFCLSWLTECRRVLKKDGSIWVIGSFQNIYRLGYIMQNLGFWILNDVIWSKPNAVPNFGGTRFQNSHETLLWCSKSKKSKYTFNYKTMKHLNNEKQDKSVWDISICIGSERIKGSDGKKIHTTQKPEKLLRKVILSSSKPNDIILDPFFGTGTTGRVAKMLGRNYIGIEKEEIYVKVAKQSIDDTIVELDSINNLELEVKPPKVSIKELLLKKYLNVNEKLYNDKKELVCSINEDGTVTDDKDTMSIHKMSAKLLRKTNNNGWDYFFIVRNEKLVSINQLRYKYFEEHINGDSCKNIN